MIHEELHEMKPNPNNTEFFLTYCFPVIVGISVAGYFEHESICGAIASMTISSGIVAGLLAIFRR